MRAQALLTEHAGPQNISMNLIAGAAPVEQRAGVRRAG